MSLLQPWWLILLGPWVGLVILALRQYRPKVLVPYLDLWPREEPQDKEKRRGWRPPAWSVLLLLVAMFLGIMALASPVWRSRRATLPRVTIIVDRGVTMLADERGRQVADRAMGILEPLLADNSEIRVMDTLGGDRLVSRGQLSHALYAPATAVDTRQRVNALVRAQVAEEAVTVLLSDHPEVDPKVVQIVPRGAVRNVGIVKAAVSGKQCLVEMRNDMEIAEVAVVISGVTHRVQLPPRGQTRQYILPASGQSIHVHLDVVDDLADDNDWWCVPDRPAPKLVLSTSVSPAVRRFAAAYLAARPQSDGQAVVIAPPNEAVADHCIIVAPADRAVSVPRMPVDHAILRNVGLPEQVLATSLPLPEGQWEPILSAGDVVMLAVDEEHRRVWVGIEMPEDSAEQVLLWTNIVEFIGGGTDTNTAPRVLDASWQRVGGALPAELNGLRAGVYERAGERTVVCVPAPKFAAAQPVPARSAEERLQTMAARASDVSWSPYLWLAAAMLVAGAAAKVAM